MDEDIGLDGLSRVKELIAEIDEELELEEIDEDDDGDTLLAEEVEVCKLEPVDDERDVATELKVTDEVEET